MFAANRSMRDRFFYDADGELLIVPQLGRADACTPSSASSTCRRARSASMPRGVKFRVELPDGSARGYICENYGQHLRLPDLGPIGTFGLANARDFLAPVAAFEDRDGDFRVVAKFGGGLWEAEIDHSPLDIVAWRGNYVPFKYDLNRFQCINTVTFDHPDPSIYCVLASPTAVPGTANMEFGCFPPRWSVAEHTFRPPPFHRNVASEFLGLISGQYIGKADAFAPGSASLHNCMSGHGPDAEAYERGQQRRAQAAVPRQHDGVPVRDAAADPADEVRARNRPARARLLHALAGAEEALRGRRQVGRASGFRRGPEPDR